VSRVVLRAATGCREPCGSRRCSGPRRTGAVDPARPALARVGPTLAFWKTAGPSERDEYASALYEIADGGPGADRTRTEEARKTITALGLDRDELNRNDKPGAATKLIAAKLAS
jgi:hypothetical protein